MFGRIYWALRHWVKGVTKQCTDCRQGTVTVCVIEGCASCSECGIPV